MDKFPEILIECDCAGGCSILKFADLDEDNESEDSLFGIEHYATSFGYKQVGIFDTIWHRIRFAWYILRGKEFFLYDVVLDYKNLLKLKSFVDTAVAKKMET
jgi:hypothetical protein